MIDSGTFAIAWAAASTEEEAAPKVIQRTRQRTEGRVGCVWISDGNPVYAEQVKKVYRDPQRTGKPGRPPLVLREDVSVTQGVKQREGGRVVGLFVRAVLGEATERAVCVCEERLNGVLRDHLNCLTRKTHAFAKQTKTWDAAVGLCLFEHNWLKSHAVGLTDHVWTWKEFLSLQIIQYKRE